MNPSRSYFSPDFYEDLFLVQQKVIVVLHFVINCFCFSFADECCEALRDGEATEKQPDMCISAYQRREPRQTHSLISDLQADLPSVCRGKGHELLLIFCCLFNIEVALSRIALK